MLQPEDFLVLCLLLRENFIYFLPHDAMCTVAYAVVRCPPICLSVSHVRVTWKGVNVFFTIWQPHQFCYAPYVMAICRRRNPWQGRRMQMRLKIAIFD